MDTELVRELLGRITALDPDAGAALQVISSFDALLEAHAGLEASVRAAATLAGCPAGLVAPGNRARIRVEADGRRAAGPPCGRRLELAGVPGGEVWLERLPLANSTANQPPPAQLDSVILERLAAVAQIILDRTRPVGQRIEPAALELLLDASVEGKRREEVATRLGVNCFEEYFPVVALSPILGSPVSADLGSFYVAILKRGEILPSSIRAALGDPTYPIELPESFDLARLALRLTTPVGEPGPSQVAVAEARGMLALSGVQQSPIAAKEIAALEHAITTYPWALATLFALTEQTSLRAAAAILHVHHSTLHDRVERLTRLTGWSLLTQTGRTRLSVGMALRLFGLNNW